jgi:transcriptional accessory protein Tex/SPT6
MAGLVRNVMEFGAFIDVGAERDGFVHVKDLSTEFVYSATDMLRPGQAVRASTAQSRSMCAHQFGEPRIFFAHK